MDHLSSPEHRRTGRVVCGMPVTVASPADWPRVRLIDLSRTGIRLGVPLDQAADLEPFTLEGLATQIRDQLAVKVVIDLDPDRLGTRVRRGLRVVRVGPVREEENLLELGCELVPPITDAEAELLALPLPRPGEPPDVARRRMQDRTRPEEKARSFEPYAVASRVPRPGTGRRASPDLQASVFSRYRRVNRVLLGKPLEFSPQGGFVCVETDGPGLLREDLSLADRVIAFGKAYGQTVDLRIRNPDKDLWYGAVRVVSVGIIPEAPGRLILGYTFCRPLDAWEEKALGLEVAHAP